MESNSPTNVTELKSYLGFSNCCVMLLNVCFLKCKPVSAKFSPSLPCYSSSHDLRNNPPCDEGWTKKKPIPFTTRTPCGERNVRQIEKRYIVFRASEEVPFVYFVGRRLC